MKKIILNSIAIFGITLSSIAQDGIKIHVKKTGILSDLVLTGDLTDYSSGHSAFVYNTSLTGTLIFDIDIENTTGSEKAWRVTRINEIGMPSNWTNSICCGVKCFPASAMNPYVTPISIYSVNPQIINTIDVSNGEDGQMSLHVNASSVGSGLFTLYLTDNKNTTHEDSIQIQIIYTLGIDDLMSNSSFSLYPNPANNHLSIQLKNNEKGNLKIVDLVGNIIYSESIVSNSKINVSEFKNGIYFVLVETNGVQTQMEKLVIKH